VIRCARLVNLSLGLAYHLLVAIETTLKQQGFRGSWRKARELLSTHKLVTVVLPTSYGGKARIRTPSNPGPKLLESCSLLRISPKPLRPVGSWYRSRTIIVAKTSSTSAP